jgi:hypothetical protein
MTLAIRKVGSIQDTLSGLCDERLAMTQLLLLGTALASAQLFPVGPLCA